MTEEKTKKNSSENLAATKKKRIVTQRVFIIFKRSHIMGKQDEIVAAKLTKSSADRIVDQIAGTYIYKVYANKE